jgi:hypothetical protein
MGKGIPTTVAPKRQHRIPIAKLLALAFAAQTIPRLAAASLHSSIPRERKYHPTVRFALMRGVRWQWYLCARGGDPFGDHDRYVYMIYFITCDGGVVGDRSRARRHPPFLRVPLLGPEVPLPEAVLVPRGSRGGPRPSHIIL